MRALVQVIRNLSCRDEGQTLTEYGLLLFFIAIVAIIAVTVLGQNISTIFSQIGASLTG